MKAKIKLNREAPLTLYATLHKSAEQTQISVCVSVRNLTGAQPCHFPSYFRSHNRSQHSLITNVSPKENCCSYTLIEFGADLPWKTPFNLTQAPVWQINFELPKNCPWPVTWVSRHAKLSLGKLMVWFVMGSMAVSRKWSPKSSVFMLVYSGGTAMHE